MPRKKHYSQKSEHQNKTQQTDAAVPIQDVPIQDTPIQNSQEAQAADAVQAKSFPDKLRQTMAAFGFPDMLLTRLIGVFFLISGLNITLHKDPSVSPVGAWQNYIGAVSFDATLFIMILAFTVLTVAYAVQPKHLRILDQVTAITGLLYFGVVLLWKMDSYLIGAGVTIPILILLYYTLQKTDLYSISENISWKPMLVIVLTAAVSVTVFVSVTSYYMHKVFLTQQFDTGIFIQTFHALANHFNAVITGERNTELSYFRVHASYILYFLMPFYKLIPKDSTLFVLQAVCAMGGVVPLFLIAKKHNYKGFALGFICFIYVFCTALIGPCYFHFHENAVLPTLLMWLIWSLDENRYLPGYIFSVLVCIVKEDAPLFVICLGMYFFFREKGSKKRFHSLIIAFAALIYMLLIIKWLVQNGDGQYMMDSRFGHLMTDQTGGMTEIVKTVLTDPGYFFSLFITSNSLKFFFEIMLPLLFLPFITKNISRYLMMLPFVITNLVIGAAYIHAADIGCQYIYGPVTILLYMCIINLDDIDKVQKHDLAVLMGTASMFLAIATYSIQIARVDYYNSNPVYFEELQNMLDALPEDASVGADSYVLPHVAARDKAYLFDADAVNMETHHLNNPSAFDIIVMPLDCYNDWGREVMENDGMVQVDELPDRFLIFYSQSYLESHPVN